MFNSKYRMSFIPKFLIIAFFIATNSFAQKNKIDSLQRILTITKNDTQKIKLTNQLAWAYFKNKEYQIAKNLVFENISASKKKNWEQGIANSYETIGEIYYQLNRKDSSIYYSLLSANIYEKNKNFIAASIENRKLGYLFLNIHKFVEAKTVFQKSLNFAQKLQDKNSETQTLIGLGWLYHQMGNYSTSNDYYSQALKLAKSLNNQEDELNIKLGFANNYIATNEYGKAQKLYFELAETYKKNKDLSQYANNLSIGANLYRRLNQVPKAEKPLLEVYKIQHQLGDKYSLITTSRYLGMLYTDLNKLDIAEKYLLESLNLSEEFRDNNDKIKAYYTLERLYFVKNDIKNGDKYQKKVIRMRDSLYTADNNKALAEFDIKYKTTEKERQLAESKLEIAQSKNWIIGLGIAFVAMIGFGFLFLRIQRDKQKAILQNLEIENTRKILNVREMERQRIAKELHDSVGSQLTIVSTSLDNAFFLAENNRLIPKKLESINFDVREAAQSLRDTIWATHNTFIPITNLYARIQHYLSKVFSENENIIHHATLVGADYNLNSIEALNLFRVFQESVQNIQKHADASLILLSLENNNNQLKLSISDNGKGFVTKTKNPYENFGLSNMKLRCDEINALLSINSAINKGTIIEVLLPLKAI
jgi:signal transduction histidine kinase